MRFINKMLIFFVNWLIIRKYHAMPIITIKNLPKIGTNQNFTLNNKKKYD